MKKLSCLMLIVAVFFVGVSSAQAGTAASENASALIQLKNLLDQARILQQKIVDQQIFAASLPYYISLLSPNGGESIEAGSMHRIVWNGLKSGLTKINIYLVTNSDAATAALKEPGTLIAKSVPVEAESYLWTVPEKLEAGSYYLLIRNSEKGLKTNDFSDAAFNITAPKFDGMKVSMSSPKGGEVYVTGNTYHMSWNMAKGGEKFVNLVLLNDAGTAEEMTYAAGEFEEYLPASEGGYNWFVPDNLKTGNYRVKIYGLNAVCTESEAKDFIISEPIKIINYFDLPNRITILSPEISSVSLGSPVGISWITPFDIDYIDIYARGVFSGIRYPVELDIASGISFGRRESSWTSKIYGKDLRYVIEVCRSGMGQCDESAPFDVIEPTTEVQTTVIDTPEYRSLQEAVSKIGDIVIGSGESAASVPAPVAAPIVEAAPAEVVVVVPEVVIPKGPFLPYTFARRLSYGLENDEAVMALQEALTKEGIFSHAITGNFYGVTKKAVQDFQTKYGLEASGSVGPGTQAKLNELYSTGGGSLSQNLNNLANTLIGTSIVPVKGEGEESTWEHGVSPEVLAEGRIQLSSFIDNFKKALETKDVEKVMAFYVKDGVDEYRKMYETVSGAFDKIRDLLQSPVLSSMNIDGATGAASAELEVTSGSQKFIVTLVRTGSDWLIQTL